MKSFVVALACAAASMGSTAEAKSAKLWLAELTVVAVESQLATDVAPQPAPSPKVPRAQCQACKGTGKVRTGDGISWTQCDACVSDAAAALGACGCGEDCDCSASGDNCGCLVTTQEVPLELALAEGCPGGSCGSEGRGYGRPQPVRRLLRGVGRVFFRGCRGCS